MFKVFVYIPFLVKYQLTSLRSLVMTRILYMTLVKFSLGFHNFPTCSLCQMMVLGKHPARSVLPGICNGLRLCLETDPLSGSMSQYGPEFDRFLN